MLIRVEVLGGSNSEDVFWARDFSVCFSSIQAMQKGPESLTMIDSTGLIDFDKVFRLPGTVKLEIVQLRLLHVISSLLA